MKKTKIKIKETELVALYMKMTELMKRSFPGSVSIAKTLIELEDIVLKLQDNTKEKEIEVSIYPMPEIEISKAEELFYLSEITLLLKYKILCLKE